MRIKLSKPQLFFNEILEKDKLSLRQFAKRIDINYSNLKQYRRGDKLLPSAVFDTIVQYSTRKDFWISDLREFEDNWGAVKGGKSASLHSNRNKVLEHARSFRKIVDVEIKLNDSFCEFYGALLGDGCMSKFKDYQDKDRYLIQFSGNKKLDSEYMKYLASNLKKEYGLSVYYYEVKNKNVCTLCIKNKGLFLQLNQIFEVPIGLKYKNIQISSKILDLTWDIKKWTLRGLFDTDGCILANKREKYRYPWISISSKSPSFLNQIKDILRTEGYPAYVSGSNVCVRGISNVKRWFSDIGSSNQRNLSKYQYFLKHDYLPARLLN